MPSLPLRSMASLNSNPRDRSLDEEPELELKKRTSGKRFETCPKGIYSKIVQDRHRAVVKMEIGGSTFSGRLNSSQARNSHFTVIESTLELAKQSITRSERN